MAHAGVTSLWISEKMDTFSKQRIGFDCDYQGFSAYEGGKLEVHVKTFKFRGSRKRYGQLAKMIKEAWLRTSAMNIYLPEGGEMVEEMKKQGRELPTGLAKGQPISTHAVTNKHGLGNFPILNHSLSKLVNVDLDLETFGAVIFLQDMIDSSGPARKLERIRFRLENLEKKADGVREARAIRQLFKAIPTFAPNLRELDIGIHPVKRTIIGSSELVSVKRPIRFITLRPLQGCEKLRTLSIHDVYPIVMSSLELDQLLHPWTTIESVTLSASTECAARQWLAIWKAWKKIGPVKSLDRAPKRPIRFSTIFQCGK
ncbi:hypothetical protein L218DRAFT_1065788 [Marasmius fiardii PR-910]|nr:hypothetical protein L218DRAFT_1065788 [Marasmius fiardii PR-910]